MKQYLLILIIVPGLIACHHTITSSAHQDFNPKSETAIDPIIIPADYTHNVYAGLHHPEAVFDFYVANQYEPFWLENNIRSAQADSMVLMIRSARRYGLLPQDYHLFEISELVLQSVDHAKMIRLDVVLTDVFLSMAHDLKRGRLRIQNDFAKLDSSQIIPLINSIKVNGIKSTLDSQEPVHKGYIRLKHALNYLLDTLNLTDHNLLMSGVTIDSIELHRKVQQIEINLERWRNEKDSLGNVYAWINIPSYMFYVIENDSVVMDSRVIVGASSTSTPELSSNIECFTVFPYWYVPRKIAVNEYLPVIKNDTNFIARNNFDVLDKAGVIQRLSATDWKKYNANNFPFVLRQREGPLNSLGVIKFVFDNPYAVYLHDTNSKRLFKHKERAFSHGCIRLEQAVKFSHYLIGGKRTKLNVQILNAYLSQQKRRTISLASPVPIHIRYLTCEAIGNELLLYRDIYQKDQQLIRMLYYHQKLF